MNVTPVTVRDLIERLSAMPPNAVVVLMRGPDDGPNGLASPLGRGSGGLVEARRGSYAPATGRAGVVEIVGYFHDSGADETYGEVAAVALWPTS